MIKREEDKTATFPFKTTFAAQNAALSTPCPILGLTVPSKESNVKFCVTQRVTPISVGMTDGFLNRGCSLYLASVKNY